MSLASIRTYRWLRPALAGGGGGQSIAGEGERSCRPVASAMRSICCRATRSFSSCWGQQQQHHHQGHSKRAKEAQAARAAAGHQHGSAHPVWEQMVSSTGARVGSSSSAGQRVSRGKDEKGHARHVPLHARGDLQTATPTGMLVRTACVQQYARHYTSHSSCWLSCACTINE